MISEVTQDVRYGIRSLIRAPGFTAVAVLTLALGIGANTAIFSFVDGVLLRPLPYPNPERILLVWEKTPGGSNNAVSVLNYLDWKEQSTVFEHIAASTGWPLTLTGHGDPQVIRTGRVAASYFDVFGVKAAIGRTFASDEDQPGKERVVVMSHRLWATDFGADPSIVGRTLTLDGQAFTVIGVLPEGTPFDRGVQRLWRPMAFATGERTRNYHWLTVQARLKPGVTIEQARAEMDGIGARMATDYPDSNKGSGVSIVRYADAVVGTQLRSALYVLLGAAGMLLLIGCANMANLTLARGTSREREVSIRAALGAGRARLVRQFLTENVLLSTLGGLAGIVGGYLLMRGLQLLLPPFFLPSVVRIDMDARVLAFTVVLSMLTGVIFGLAPALHATKPDLSSAMKEGGRGAAGDGGRGRLRGALVVVEVALAFMLLAGAGLLVRSFFDMMNLPLGFDPTNVLTLRLPMANDRSAHAEELTAYVRSVVDRVRAVPGVRGAAATDSLPLEGFFFGMTFQIAGREALDRPNRPECGFQSVQADYFRVLGIQIVKGRPLTERDVRSTAPVTVINQQMATRYFAGQDPIGQHVLVREIVPGKPVLGPEIPWEIVGVSADERTGGLEGSTRPGMYVPMEQSPTMFVNLVVRAAVDADTLSRSIGTAVHEIDRLQAVTDVRTLEQMKSESAAPNRLRTGLLAVFASLALLLSGIGIYGVISYSVAQRTREIGVRAALGAPSGALLRMVLTSGMTLAGVGLALGLAGALALTQVLGSLLIGVGARDPLTMTVSAAVLATVAFAACYIPARRAATLDPLVALREM